MTKTWYCLGGPLHGTYQPAGSTPIHSARLGAAGRPRYYYNGTPVPTVAVPAPPVTYYPMTVQLPGWRISVTMYMDEAVVYGHQRIPSGTVLPGGIKGAQLGACVACRWCYGPSFGELGVCLRTVCVSAVSWLESIDSWRWTGGVS